MKKSFSLNLLTVSLILGPAPGQEKLMEVTADLQMLGDHPQEVLGIFWQAGDVLVLCLSKPGQPRPSEFTAKPEAGQELLLFQRARLVK